MALPRHKHLDAKEGSNESKESSIPYSTITAFAQYNAELNKKIAHANTLQTADEVIEYVRNIKKEDGFTDEYAQFMILAYSKTTAEQYSFLSDYVDSDGHNYYGHEKWDEIKKGLEYERGCNWFCGVPYLFALSTMSFFSTAGAVAVLIDSAAKGNASLELAAATFSSAILGGLTFYKAKSCASVLGKDFHELVATRELMNTLRKTP